MRRLLGVLALIGVLNSGAGTAADSFGPMSIRPAAHPFRVGALQLTALRSAQFVLPNDCKIFGVDSTVDAVGDVLRAGGAPTDRITLNVDALLVRTAGRTVLIDSGLGSKSHGNVTGSLAEAGVSPKAVTDVLITHTHGDHIGGVLDENQHLVFPKATIRMAKAEWDSFQKSGSPEFVKAIAAHVKTFEPGAKVAPGITSVPLEGHTPGHVGYEISSKGERLLDIGDMAHSSIISLAKPEWTMGFDGDPSLAKKTRQTVLLRLANEHELVFAPHFPYPGIGHIVTAGNGFAWKAGAP